LNLKIIDGANQQFRGDRRRIMQVLQHMVQNAVKFTERGAIDVSVSLDKERDNQSWVRFTVTDTGIGMAPSAVAGMFAPFVQADGSSTRKYGGVGLGLSISKRMVKLMGGDIGATSMLDKGSTFWFTVPLDLDSGQICENKKTK
jgi:signal transduction histidine kinase